MKTVILILLMANVSFGQNQRNNNSQWRVNQIRRQIIDDQVARFRAINDGSIAAMARKDKDGMYYAYVRNCGKVKILSNKDGVVLDRDRMVKLEMWRCQINNWVPAD